RILGENFNVTPGVVTVPQGVQTDLFGNPVETKTESASQKPEAAGADEDRAESEEVIVAGKNIQNTPHQYRAMQDDDSIKELIKELMEEKEICFDTETTGIDANDVELVGMSFSFKPGEGYYVPVPADQEAAKKLLKKFAPVFERKDILWVGQN